MSETCKFCKTPIADRYKVCGTCSGLREEAFYRTMRYRDVMARFALREGETPQQLHARIDELIAKFAGEKGVTDKRQRFEERYTACMQCGTTTKRHERYCDYYVPPRKRAKP